MVVRRNWKVLEAIILNDSVEPEFSGAIEIKWQFEIENREVVQ